MTPSGLSIGTILKTNLSLNIFAGSSLLTKYWIRPSITNELFDSPGWTRPLRMIHFLLAIWSYDDVKFVIINISRLLPAKVLHKEVLLMISGDSYGAQILSKKLMQSVYV